MQRFSPMMTHYLQTKESYKDCILMYRLGDFYEMFFEDAKTASNVLDLVLTGRDCGNGQRAPMCGVPFHAVDTYIAKLVSAGLKVAICEQLSEPNGKGIVERDVVRVITAGTVMDTSLLDEKSNNFIASVMASDGKIGCAVCDLSTGFVATSEFSGAKANANLQEFLVSFKPTQVISDANTIEFGKNLDCVKAGYVPKFEEYFNWVFAYDKAKSKILSQYKLATLEGLGFDGKKLAVGTVGALLEYVVDTQKRPLSHLQTIKYIEKNQYMSIDVKTRKNLELTVSNKEKRKGSLLGLLDKTSTSMGARLLADWLDRPLQNPAQINARLDGVEELFKNYILNDTLSQALQKVRDIERIAAKISYDNLSPKDCNVLGASLEYLPTIKTLLSKCKSQILVAQNNGISPLQEVKELLQKAIVDNAPLVARDGGFIKDGYNQELDEFRSITRNGKQLVAELENFERERSGIKTLKLGYNRVFGYYFEISKGLVDKVPDYFIRKQTLVNGERFITPELKELEEKIVTADDKIVLLEKTLFNELRNKLLEYVQQLQKTAYSIAVCDCLLSFAKVALSNNYTKPKINVQNSTLNIVEGRHPVVESYVKRENFISNDTLLDTQDNRTMVITGPNMAGKSTYMRQVALITLMAHVGSFVPAKTALIPIVDKIFTRVGASDDLAFNQSTFMVEMVEVANILNNATKKSLLVLDEIGRGTSTFDGLAIAWAVMEHISKNLGAKTLFATHFHELTDLEGKVEGVKNYRITVKEYNEGIIFLHKIVRGGANKSFGVEVASLAGVPDVVCNRAKEITNLLEKSDINMRLDDLEDADKKRKNNKNAKEIVAVLKDVDINRMSPIEAFDMLGELIKKARDE
ncbi:MAG: DNA mismatch repair protein MutS [Clostridia bacterium]|nr:DNA mismatch repair protein MutS [Clostridia bacterium]